MVSGDISDSDLLPLELQALKAMRQVTGEELNHLACLYQIPSDFM